MRLMVIPAVLVGFAARRLVEPARAPDVRIGPDQSDPYLARWWIWRRNRLFNAYLHHFRHSDDDRALHDHPWWSVSLVLRGRLFEITGSTDPNSSAYRKRKIASGEVVLRSGRYAHRLELAAGETAWTLFLTGPRIREWGFHCPHGWRPWREFCDPIEPGRPGRGCE